jgi:hypothetical protein
LYITLLAVTAVQVHSVLMYQLLADMVPTETWRILAVTVDMEAVAILTCMAVLVLDMVPAVVVVLLDVAAKHISAQVLQFHTTLTMAGLVLAHLDLVALVDHRTVVGMVQMVQLVSL